MADLRGITFSKQYPNDAEPVRGLFVEQQVRDTRAFVDWTVIAPVPWAPPGLRGIAGRPKVAKREFRDNVHVYHPAYLAGPAKVGYERAAASMASASRSVFAEHAEGAQFVSAHGVYPVGAAALGLAAPLGLPTIITVHGSDLYEAMATPGLKQLATDAARGAAAFVTVSSALADDAARLLGLKRDAIRVIPDAYRDDVFALTERPAHDPKRPIRLLCVARLEAVKGVDVLVEAVGALVADGYNLELDLIGAGSMEEQLRDRVRSAKLAERVRFLGPMSPAEIATALGKADLYVQPSRREGFGVALVEALATGVPAVSTRSGGPSEILRPADGQLAEPDDALSLADAIAAALERLRVGDFDSAAIAEGARERYAPEAVARQLVALYNEVARRAPSA